MSMFDYAEDDASSEECGRGTMVLSHPLSTSITGYALPTYLARTMLILRSDHASDGFGGI